MTDVTKPGQMSAKSVHAELDRYRQAMAQRLAELQLDLEAAHQSGREGEQQLRGKLEQLKADMQAWTRSVNRTLLQEAQRMLVLETEVMLLKRWPWQRWYWRRMQRRQRETAITVEPQWDTNQRVTS